MRNQVDTTTIPLLREVIAQPKALFLVAVAVSFLLSITLWFGGDKQAGLFVGIWVPSIASVGTLILQGGRHE